MQGDLFHHSEYRALFRFAAEDGWYSWPLVADWLDDHGAHPFVANEARTPRTWLSPFDVWSFGRGSGIGSGSGRGSGSGSGSGIGSGSGSGIGIGSGRGRGSGSGIGSGRGSGIGSGIGSGSGSGSGRGEPYEVHQMEVGQAYLLFCGDWHAFVGRVEAQIGPFTYRLIDVSKVAETNNGDNWELLAGGDKNARDRATYRHYKTPGVFPLTIAAFEWVGKLPQEEKG